MWAMKACMLRRIMVASSCLLMNSYHLQAARRRHNASLPAPGSSSAVSLENSSATLGSTASLPADSMGGGPARPDSTRSGGWLRQRLFGKSTSGVSYQESDDSDATSRASSVASMQVGRVLQGSCKAAAVAGDHLQILLPPS